MTFNGFQDITMTENSSDLNELETIEADLLLDGVHRLYGYDFRNYAKP